MLEERRKNTGPNWILAYDSFEPEQEGLREAITSTGNGYFCTRGAVAWSEADRVSYPGTYAHGRWGGICSLRRDGQSLRAEPVHRPPVAASLVLTTDLPLDAHLMVDNPANLIPRCSWTPG